MDLCCWHWCCWCFGSIYYLGWTEAGLQRLVSLANRRLGPVTLSLAGARGTLHDGVHFDRIEVDHQRVQVIATGIEGRVALLPLLWQTISVTRLDIGDVLVHVLPHVSQPGDVWEPHFLVGLLNIEAVQLHAGHAKLISPGGTTLEADQLHAAAQIGTREIRIFDSTLNYSGFEVRSSGTVRAAQSIGLRGHIRLSRPAPAGEAPWLADGSNQRQSGLAEDQCRVSGAVRRGVPRECASPYGRLALAG